MPRYLAVRCHGLATHLLPSKVMEALASSKEQVLDTLADVLSPTDYGTSIRELEKIDAFSLEHVFDDELLAKYKYLVSAAAMTASKAAKDFLNAYSRRAEIQTLSKILRTKMRKSSKGSISLTPSSEELSDLRFSRFLEAENVEKVVELLQRTRYSSIAKALDLYHEYDSVLPLESHMRKIYYRTVLEALRGLPSRDRKSIRQLLGIEVDVANCFTAVAPILYGYSTELSKQLVIPYFFRLSRRSVESAITAKSPRAVLDHLKSYGEIVEALMAKNEVLAEARALGMIRREVKKTMLQASIDFAYVICYLTLHEIQRRNLTFITYLTRQNLEARDYLIV